MSIQPCTSTTEVNAIADPKQVTWVGPGNRWEVKTGADIDSPPQVDTSDKTIEAAHVSVETLKVRRGINHAIPNVETLAGNKLLTTDSVDHQFLDGGISDRVVRLPVPESATGRRFTIVNRSSSNSIVVKSASITVITIPASKAGFVISDGQSWLGALGV